MNHLYYGDNLDVLRRYIGDETVDLVYLDPPFKSNQNYNVLFAERDGSQAASQIKAFEDTWTWNQSAAEAYEDVIVGKNHLVSQALQAFRTLLGTNDMLAYLSMMAPRLVELHRVLKTSGSVYLHCDPTASHYLKILMDAVFRPGNIRNEIIWQRTISKSNMSIKLPKNHDVILAYQKSEEATWNTEYAFQPYDLSNLDEKTASKYRHRDPDGRLYRLDNLLSPSHNRPNLTYEFLGVSRVWRWTKDRMQAAYEAGLVVQTKPGAVPCLKRYIDEQRGRPLGDVWTDIPPINSMAKERLGYPTQKPEALLERIIRLSSNEGQTILDPFCGCGTAISVAQRLGRQWIGIDVTNLAISLIRHRLRDAHGDDIESTYEVVGEPVSIQDAKELAASDPYQFQWWALGLVGARPVEGKKGADKGIDGRIFFLEDMKSGKAAQIILSVKAGHVTVSHLRDLRGVVDREKAAIGVFLSMEQPTKPMVNEAASAGFYTSPWSKHPKLQLLTVEELLAGNQIDSPPRRQTNVTFKQAPKSLPPTTEQKEMFKPSSS